MKQKNMKLNKVLIPVVLMGILSGCNTPQPVDQTLLRNYPLERNPHAPVLGKMEKARVVLLGVKSNSSAEWESPGLGDALGSELKSRVSSSGTVTLVERDLVAGLRDELIQAELEGMTGIDSNVVDFVVLGQVSNAGFESTYNNPDDGDAYYSERAGVSGSLLVYEVKSRGPVSIVHSIPFSGSEWNRADRRATRNPSLTRAAGLEGIRKNTKHLLNSLRPPAQILGAETDGKRCYVRVSLGRAHGVEAGGKVAFRTHRVSRNQLTREEAVELIDLAVQGTVSGSIQTNSALVEVPEEDIKRLRIGDIAHIKGKVGFMEKIGNFVEVDVSY